MDAAARPIIPLAPKVHSKDLSTWRLVLAMTSNSLGAWPERSFDEAIGRNRVLGREAILLSDPEGVRHVLATERLKYGRPQTNTRSIRPLAGAGVLLAEGETWRRQRRMLAPVFTPAHVELILPHLEIAAGAMLGRLSGVSRANLSNAFHEATLDVVLRALFSLPGEAQRAEMARLVRRYLAGPGRPNLFDGLANQDSDFAWAEGKRRRFQRDWFAEVDRLVDERRGGPAGQHRDLLDLLLAARDPESGEALSAAEVRDQSATMLFAGFETTSRLLFWAIYLLALDPIEQARLRREIAASPPERVRRLEDMQAWPRLRQVLLEALRLYPPAAHILRQALEDDTILGEHVRPGTLVWISPWVIHRHRKYWDQPTAFMPDRFAGQTSPWTSYGPFLPFGGGPRICIGAAFAMAEAQYMLASLLSRFEVTLDDPRPVMPVGGVTTVPSVEPSFRLNPVGA